MKVILVLTILSSYLINNSHAKSKWYDGPIRPYNFGYSIEGNQHRHEEKNEKGEIMGEFGFITGDGVYHVTGYATDENGNFKILFMRNLKIGLNAVADRQLPIDDIQNTDKLPVQEQILKRNPGIKLIEMKDSDIPSCSSCAIPEPEVMKKIIKSKFPDLLPASFIRPDENPSTALPPIDVRVLRPLSQDIVEPQNNINKQSGKSNSPNQRNLGQTSVKQPPAPRKETISNAIYKKVQEKPVDRPQTKDKQQNADAGFNEPNVIKTKIDAPNNEKVEINRQKFPTTKINEPNVSTIKTNQQQTNDGPQVNPSIQGANNIIKTQPSKPIIPNGNQFESNSVNILEERNYDVTAQLPQIKSGPLPKQQKTINKSVDNSKSVSFDGKLNKPSTNQNIPSKKSSQENLLKSDKGKSVASNQSKPRKPEIEKTLKNVLKTSREMSNIVNQKLSEKSKTPETNTNRGRFDSVTSLNNFGQLYRFNYTVTYHGHYEEGDRNGNKNGTYFVVGRDGLERKVDYYANEFGYQPHLKLKPIDSQDKIPNEENEKNAELKGYEFKWFNA